jgi:hypothetical protein
VVDLFHAAFDVGGNASVGSLASIFTDLNTATQGAFVLATRAAEAQAERNLVSLALAGTTARLVDRKLVEGIERLGGGVYWHTQEATDEAQRSWYEIWKDVRERLSWLLPFLLSSNSGAEPWANLAEELRSREIAAMLPRQPYRLRSVRYENPLILEILSEGGFATLALSALLRLIRDWGSRRRLEDARASDAEDRLWFRTQLRTIAVQQLARGELRLTPEIIRDLLSDDLVNAVGELSVLQPSVDQEHLPGGEG